MLGENFEFCISSMPINWYFAYISRIWLSKIYLNFSSPPLLEGVSPFVSAPHSQDFCSSPQLVPAKIFQSSFSKGRRTRTMITVFELLIELKLQISSLYPSNYQTSPDTLQASQFLLINYTITTFFISLAPLVLIQPPKYQLRAVERFQIH